MVCNSCSTEYSDTFKFCPQCGKAAESILATQPAIGPDRAEQKTSQNRIQSGTVVLLTFAVISLIVSVVNGLVPIYLIEAAAWGGLAWYWQSRNEHSEAAKGIVVIAAVIVTIGEVIHFTAVKQKPTPLAATLQTNNQPTFDQPKPISPCPSGVPSGVRIVEIPSDQVTATSGQLWHEPPDKLLSERGGWYFHFVVTNNAKDFCVTAIDYSVQLAAEIGALIEGHGRKHLGPLPAGWVYTPQERDPDDRVIFSKAVERGELSSWNVTNVYGFSQADHK